MITVTVSGVSINNLARMLMWCKLDHVFKPKVHSRMSHVRRERKKKEMMNEIDFLGGFFGGVVSTYVGHPMDTVKVRMQVILVSLLITV